MNQQLLGNLGKQYETTHGCYRPTGGPCFYIASHVAAADFGRRQGRRFVAAVEDGNGDLDVRVSLTFLVAAMAQRVKRDLIGDLDSFCREVGLERLRESLDRDHDTPRDEEVVLTREDDDSLFRRPSPKTVIGRYQTLKTSIIHVLADRHARGTQRVPTTMLLEGLCDDPLMINRALNELVELKLLRDLNHCDGMLLTAEGQRIAETTIVPASVEKTAAAPVPRKFDFFISYASEDRDVAEALDDALSERGYTVWRDRGQLTLGDSLTARINEGLATSRFAIVVLSHAFLGKNWPQAELNALQARAIAEGQKVILPVRRALSHAELAKQLPLLGDKLTIAFDQNLQTVVDEIDRAVR
jgi:hypothetical protein